MADDPGYPTGGGPSAPLPMSAPAPDPAAQEAGLVADAMNWAERNPGAAAGTAAGALFPPALAGWAAAGAGYDWLKEKLVGRGTEGQAKGERDVENETNRRGFSLPSWAGSQVADVTVGYTKGGMRPNTSSQQRTTEETVLPAPFWAAVGDMKQQGEAAAAIGSGAKVEEQEALYDLARELEDDRRSYVEQEKAAANRFVTDNIVARGRLDAARERLAQYGEAPRATIAAAFEKANGLQKVMGLAGFLMGGVGAAGFSALSHRPEKNSFVESFEREAGKVVDSFMTDRDTAGKLLAAEREGMDAIRQSFGDERAAREFVMASVMNTYKARLEQIAAQYGIDRARADYQEMLAQISGKVADYSKLGAARIQDTTQESQKYVPPQPIKVKVPIVQLVAKQLDPTLARDVLEHEAKRAAYDPADYDPEYDEDGNLTNPFLREEAALQARQKRLDSAVAQAGAQQLFGPQPKDVEARIQAYGDAREKRGINDLDDVSLAVDRIARKMSRTDQGWLQDYANLIASGGSPGVISSFLAQHVAPDSELYNDLAYVSNTYIKSLSGGAVPVQEMTRMISALGAGDAQGVANFNNNLKRSINVAESQLIRQYGIDAARIYHGRGQYLQDTQTPLPHRELRSPE